MYHTTATWEKILISDMTYDHLKNTILMFIKNIKQLNELLNNKIVENLDTILSWYRKIHSKEQIKNMILDNKNNIVHYIFESSIRWIHYTTELQELFWRKDKTNIANTIMFSWHLLSSDQNNIYDDTWE